MSPKEEAEAAATSITQALVAEAIVGPKIGLIGVYQRVTGFGRVSFWTTNAGVSIEMGSNVETAEAAVASYAAAGDRIVHGEHAVNSRSLHVKGKERDVTKVLNTDWHFADYNLITDL